MAFGTGEAVGRPTPARLMDRLNALARIRYQLLGGILFAVVLPFIIGADFALEVPTALNSPERTLVGSLLALTLGMWILRRMMEFPGIRALSFVLTSFASSYAVTILIFFFARVDYSRLQLALSFLLILPWSYLTVIIERRVRHPRLFVLPYGDAPRLAEVPGADWIMAPTGVQLRLPLGDAEDGDAGSQPEGLSEGPLGGLPPGVSGVVADLRVDLPPRIEEFLANCALRGIPVYHSKQIRESLAGRVEIDHLAENTLGSLIPSSLYFSAKRFFDVALAVLSLPLFAAVLAATAIAIKRDDGGRIFFRQRRVGYRGQVFTILKFRTMREGSENGELFTTDGDDRVTRVGRILRRYRIDELPQIINILRGEMSWIGPRPESERLSRWYANKIPFYVYRHIVLPGISGWAAVNQGNVAQLPAATGKLHYDFFYIKNFSPWMDLLVTIRTIGIVLTGFGAR